MRYDALVNHPWFGSLWLLDVEVVETKRGTYVVGDAEDNSVPEGVSPMNFPATCVRKWDPEQPEPTP